MDEKAINTLLEKYKQGTANDEEKALLESWYLKFEEPNAGELSLKERFKAVDTVWANLENEHTNIKRVSVWPRMAAASVLILLSVSAYYIFNKKAGQKTAQNQIQDIAPGGNKAVLTSNGKKYLLNDLKNGLLLKKGGVAVQKLPGGELAYNTYKGTGNDLAVEYDTLTIPRGGQFQLKLSDGSKMWLNAFTQVRYPTRFKGKERQVELIYGEAYFEVMHNDAVPFKVAVKGQTVKDIGTHFNINAYNDEPAIKTTLIEGSVAITNKKQQAVLLPGNQAVVNRDQQIEIIKNADTEKSIAWKNGFFNFEGADVSEVMRQISRWYDVDITYEGNIPKREFSGKIYRSTNAAKVLAMLNYTRIHFRIEESKSGKKIIVTP